MLKTNPTTPYIPFSSRSLPAMPASVAANEPGGNILDSSLKQDSASLKTKRNYELIKISDRDSLLAALDTENSDQTLNDRTSNLKDKLDALIYLTKSNGQELFVCKSEYGNICISAPDESSIERNQDFIDKIAQFQSRINRQELWGRCDRIHNLAAVEGLAYGVAKSVKATSRISITPNLCDLHVIAYKDSKPANERIFFDLTAVNYVFKSDQPAASGKISAPIAASLIIIEEQGTTKSIDALYSRKWQVTPKDSLPMRERLSSSSDLDSERRLFFNDIKS